VSSLNCLTPKDFSKAHHKKGYKEIGWIYARVMFSQDEFSITEPTHSSTYSPDDGDYEHIVWDGDDPIAEFRSFDDAHKFLKLKTS